MSRMASMEQDRPLGATILPFTRPVKVQAASHSPEPTLQLPVSAMIQFVGDVREYLLKFATMHDDIDRFMDLLARAGLTVENRAAVLAINKRSQAIVASQAAGLLQLLEQLALIAEGQ